MLFMGQLERIYGSRFCNHTDANYNGWYIDYSCHDNGDYSLSFDGIDDWIEIPDRSL